mgnify:CR=1 FL=1
MAPMIRGYAKHYIDKNWDAIWLSWNDDPSTTVVINWHWGQKRVAYIQVWNTTHRWIVTIENETTLFHVELRNLSPGCKYNYVIGYYDGEIMRNWSDIHWFKTAPREATSFRVLIHSDTHAPSYGAFGKFIGIAKKEEFDFIIHCGDMVDRGYEVNWAYFLSKETEIASNHQLMAIAGNHEVMYGGKERYATYMALPGREYWYSFVYSNAMFVALYVADYDNFTFPEEEEEMFIEAMEYAERNNLWKIVYFHIPIVDVFPQHYHLDMPKILFPLLNKYKPHVVIMGHNHIYGRMQINETTYIIVSSTGGIPGVIVSKPGALERYNFGYGYLLMDVYGERIDFTYKDLDGNIVDIFSVLR